MAIEPRQKQGLSQAAYEALSIIAYNEPVTKAKIEKIRGVNSDSTITRLVERNLIEDAGRLDAPGRPILFKTTEEFLRSFGLKSVKDLPQIQFGMNEPFNEQSDLIGSEDDTELDAEIGLKAEMETAAGLEPNNR